ncbi:hypothetical protein AcV5_008051 [Taiwanofungus camphoratus]|nr:hypothetical protein AcV5_008051 [Antrodia cinnamomea]
MMPAAYPPSSQLPFHNGSAKVARHTIVYFLRRRGILAVLLASTLLFVFLFLKATLKDVDELGLSTTPSVNSYLPFEPSFAPQPSPSLRPVHALPVSCLDSHFELGQPCYDQTAYPLDVIWTWVNGSDDLLEHAKTLAQSKYSSNDPFRPIVSKNQERLYRDHDELRHSMRSVLDNFRAHAGRFHLITADFPVPDSIVNNVNSTLDASWRLGQIPQWLDLDKRTASGDWWDGRVGLSVTHHAEIFSPYSGTNFNSLAIESQFSHLEHISENFIYMNDDLFMMKPLTPASFYTSAYGLVLNLQSNLMVPPYRQIGKNQGEWRSLRETNFLLSNRFGSRHRPYVAHEAKTASLALLHEMSVIWPDAFARTATHLFRETQNGDGDVNTMFMLTHFIVERAREALLWSWVVGRIGGVDDSWGEQEAAQAWRELGGVSNETSILVQSEMRQTLEKGRIEKVLRDSGYKGQSRTSYIFSSLDGYPYVALGTNGQMSFPSFSSETDPGRMPRCRISFDQCFQIEATEDNPSRASEVFKNLAFRKHGCGDCVTMALVQASGSLGLSAFLPLSDRVLPSLARELSGSEKDIPHLPLVDDWQNGDFSLGGVMGSTQLLNIREWTLQLLQRYRYVIGETPSLFERISGPRGTAVILNRVDKNRDIALLCINDDVAVADAQVAKIMKDWQDRRWKRPATWERS